MIEKSLWKAFHQYTTPESAIRELQEMQDVLGALCVVEEKWISDLVWEYPQITVNLETVSNFQGWACDLAALSQVLYVIFNDINNTEEGRMVLDLFGVFNFFFLRL